MIHRLIPANDPFRDGDACKFFGNRNLQDHELGDFRYFFCDSLAFFKEGLHPLKFQPQPKRNLIPYRDEIVGLNTGPGTLPFPTREQTILPTNFEKDFKVSVRETAKHEFEFRYAGKDATVVYDYKPAQGTLSEITARVDGGHDFHPLDGGGVRFTGTPEGQIAKGALLEAKLTGDVVHARFRMGSHIVDYALRLWQKSLVLDAWCDGGAATELSFGKVSGVTQSAVDHGALHHLRRHQPARPRLRCAVKADLHFRLV